MGAPLKITGPVGPDAKYPPNLRVTFKGKDQAYLFSFRKMGREMADLDATGFARLLIIDFVREFRESPENQRYRRVRQMALGLRDETKKPKGRAE